MRVAVTFEPFQFGKYLLVAPLAQGGMAEIFLAKQQGPAGYEKTVVIKRVLSHYSSHSDFVAMFLDEARLAAQLSHPNIVQIFDFGEADGSYYLCMEYLRGEDLHTFVKFAHSKQTPVPAQVAVTVVAAACDALDYAHALTSDDGRPLNIVHRDISPSNIFVTFQGVVKVLDFGIARAEGKIVKTAAGMIRGKIAYMAPEQARSGPLDGRADVWALGTVLHELLTGKRLFWRGNDVETFRALLKEPIPPPRQLNPEIPKELDQICVKALQRNPNDRYKTAGEMSADLDQYLSARPYVPAQPLLQAYVKELMGEEAVAARLNSALSKAPLLTPGEMPAAHTPRSRSLEKLPLTTPPNAEPEAQQATVGIRRRSTASMPIVPAPEVPPSAPAVAGAKSPLPLIGGIVAFLGIVIGLVYALATDEVPERVEWRPIPVETIRPDPRPEEPEPAEVDAGPPAPQPAPVPVPVVPPPKYVERPPDVPDPAPPLDPNKGLLDVNCVPWCRISLDGKDTGRVSPALGIPLLAGKHRLRVVNQSGLVVTQDIVISKGAVTREVLMF